MEARKGTSKEQYMKDIMHAQEVIQRFKKYFA